MRKKLLGYSSVIYVSSCVLVMLVVIDCLITSINFIGFGGHSSNNESYVITDQEKPVYDGPARA
jgi:hypothetical protein